MSRQNDYFARAESWAVDTRVLVSRSRRVAWIIAGIAVAVALFEAVALALLTPLKTVQPVTILVDRQTGFVQAIDPVVPRKLSADAALTQSFLSQYVTAREGFDRAIAAIDYRKVALWSADRARSDYVAVMPAANPGSPFQRYPAGSVVSVRVKSVSRLSQNVALIRYDTQRQDRTGRVDPVQPWVSVVQYRYVDAPMSMEDRLINPLGFQVVSYRRDPEAPPPPAVQTQTTSGVSANLPIAPPKVVIENRRVPVRQGLSGLREVAPVRREVPINQLPMGSPLVSAP